ncbi:hypothetical protein ACA910_016885 [Epithemia clementina (nom. ined.)]
MSNFISNDESNTAESESKEISSSPLLQMKQWKGGRRRYRRPCPVKEVAECHKPKQNQKKQRRFSLDDNCLAFLERELPQKQQEQAYFGSVNTQSHSVLSLLIHRESNTAFSRSNWQRDMMFQPEQTCTKHNAKTYCSNSQMTSVVTTRKWRSWIEQKIPFTALETPISVAILALEANSGSYALGLTQSSSSLSSNCIDTAIHGTSTQKLVSPTLALHLYGVPSCNSFAQKRRFDIENYRATRRKRKRPENSLVAPKLMTIPLCFDDDDDHAFSWMHATNRNGSRDSNTHRLQRRESSWDEDPLEHLYGQHMNKCVDLCISSDWRVGLAIVWMPRTLLSRTISHPADAPSTTTTRMASLVLFSLTTASKCVERISGSASTKVSDDNISVLRAMHVPVSTMFGMQNCGCNLFWKVPQIPINAPQSVAWQINQIYEFPAYLLLIDDAEGYRVVWFAESGWQMNEFPFISDEESLDTATILDGHNASAAAKMHWRTSSRPILVPISAGEPAYWKKRLSDRQSGAAFISDEEDENDSIGQEDYVSKQHKDGAFQIRIVQECQLLILSLLSDILERRPSLLTRVTAVRSRGRSSENEPSSFCIPDYAYEIVSTCHDGRIIKLVLGFATTAAPATTSQKKDKSAENVGNAPAGKRAVGSKQYVAVLVAVDLWTQRYLEIQWVKISMGISAGSSKSTAQGLSKRILELCVEFRTRELSGSHNGQQQGQPKQHTLPANGAGHLMVKQPQECASGEEHKIASAIKQDGTCSPLSVLYPDCDTLSNRNVLRGLPVMSISSRAPVELIYG